MRKKKHKAIGAIGAGALVYGICIIMGVYFLNGDNSQKTHQQGIATLIQSNISIDIPESLSKWMAGVHPAAGNNK